MWICTYYFKHSYLELFFNSTLSYLNIVTPALFLFAFAWHIFPSFNLFVSFCSKLPLVHSPQIWSFKAILRVYFYRCLIYIHNKIIWSRLCEFVLQYKFLILLLPFPHHICVIFDVLFCFVHFRVEFFKMTVWKADSYSGAVCMILSFLKIVTPYEFFLFLVIRKLL